MRDHRSWDGGLFGPKLPPDEPKWSMSYPPQQEQILGRTVDPIRAAALHEAVQHIAHYGKPDGAWLEEQVITVANRFERWLVGTDEATL